MSFTISLHKESTLTDTVKYRSAYPTAAIFTTNVVDIGNFSNKNIYVDNSVEIAAGDNTISSYDKCIQANVIKIVHGSSVIIGFITDWDYINDSNTRLTYKVDAFTSARTSGFITNMSGLCERTNLTYKDSQSLVNLLPEPFSPSDIMRASSGGTKELNDIVLSFEGVPVTSNAIFSNNTKFALTVSPAVMKFLGTVQPWYYAPTSVTPEMKVVDDFNFVANDITVHSGGIFRGTPLVFENITGVRDFIRSILSGCGFRTILPPSGYKNDGEIRRQYVTPENSSGGNAYFTEANTDGLEIESTRFITSSDIYNLYCLPANFTYNVWTTLTWYGNEISSLPDLSTFHGMGAEDNSKSKLLAYPYNYCKVVTANGDSVNLITQIYNKRNEPWSNLSKLRLDLKFIGGDTPRMMGRFVPTFSPDSPNDSGAVSEWFTVRSYPAITISINNSYNPQLQREMNQQKQVSAVYVNSVTSAQLNSPFKQGYLDSVNGNSSSNSNNSGFNNLLYGLGGAIGNLQNSVAQYDVANGNTLIADANKQAAQNANVSANANSMVSPDVTYINGNDFLTQYATPAFTMYAGGASNAELFSFARYFDMFGQSCNCIINPLTNSGDIWAGLASVTTYNGRTFYQYSYIDVNGVMPNEWKQNIKALFESGVYLI